MYSMNREVASTASDSVQATKYKYLEDAIHVILGGVTG